MKKCTLGIKFSVPFTISLVKPHQFTKGRAVMKKKGKKLIFVTYITTRSGKRIYASNYGRKAFAIWVKA